MTEGTTSIEPLKAEGYDVMRFNALRHGVLSSDTVLPWEDVDEYRALVAALVTEHAPQDRPRSTWSRNWPASFGASVAFVWPRLSPTDEGWTAGWRPTASGACR